MFDGIKIIDVAVRVDNNGQPSLLTNDRLTFAGLVDPQTGFVLSRIRQAFDRGLTFRLVPRRSGQGNKVEVKGSLHKFHNQGQHYADQFSVDGLVLTLDELVTNYGFDPFNSKINNIEFGVNVVLPFPAAELLRNLVSYKNKPFYRDSRSQTPYYECQFQQFTLKLYDKGKQKGFGDYLLRVEIKVMKMAYFNNTGVRLNTLADLLNVTNYEPLGALLVNAFTQILFDDPSINADRLTPRERDICQNGRNPRYWQIPDDLTPKQATAYRQRLHRAERNYRALLDQYGGGNWQAQTAALIGQTWERLTTVDDNLLTRINEHRMTWKNTNNAVRVEGNSSNKTEIKDPEKCHELTGVRKAVYCETTVKNTPETCHKLTDPSEPKMSQINPLYSALQCDINTTPINTHSEAVVCPITGLPIPPTSTARRGVRRFVSPAMLRNDDDLLMRLNSMFRQYAKGSKEDEFSRAAHNARNAFHNEPNNLRRRINRINRQPTLFDVRQTLRLTADQRAALDHWRGTPYEVGF